MESRRDELVAARVGERVRTGTTDKGRGGGERVRNAVRAVAMRATARITRHQFPAALRPRRRRLAQGAAPAGRRGTCMDGGGKRCWRIR